MASASPFRTALLLAAGAAAGASGTCAVIAGRAPADFGSEVAPRGADDRAVVDRAAGEPIGAAFAGRSLAGPRNDSRAAADLDPAGFLARARGAARLDELADGLELLVASDPAAVFELVLRSGVPRGSRLADVQALAVRAMVERAPLETLARLEALPLDGRAELLRMAGEAYARIDAEGAIRWMQSLEPRSPSAERGVIAAIAAVDFGRALALEQSLPQTSFIQSLLGAPGAALDGAMRDPRNAATVATALMRRDEQHAPQLLASVLSTWITRNTDAALDFIHANEDELDPALATSVAAKLAAADLDRAIASVEIVPPAWREAWVMRTASAYAEKDVEAAVAWIGGYRELAAYDEILAHAIVAGAARDPAFAARRVETLSPTRRSEAVTRIVGSWLREDSVAATRWVQSLSDPELAANAIGSLIFQWVQFEPQAAERWTLGAAPGPLRDAALRMLMRSSDTGQYDPTSFLGEFSSTERRRDAVRWAATMLRADVERSEKLLRAALEDPALAEWAREQLAALAASR